MGCQDFIEWVFYWYKCASFFVCFGNLLLLLLFVFIYFIFRLCLNHWRDVLQADSSCCVSLMLMCFFFNSFNTYFYIWYVSLQLFCSFFFVRRWIKQPNLYKNRVLLPPQKKKKKKKSIIYIRIYIQRLLFDANLYSFCV